MNTTRQNKYFSKAWIKICIFGVFFLGISLVTTDENGITIGCFPINMTLYIEKNIGADPNSSVTFKNNSCHANTNGTHFILSSNYEDCGTTQIENGDEIIFQNTASVTLLPSPHDLIMRYVHISKFIVMKCSFKKSVVTSTGVITITGDGFTAWSDYSECNVLCGGGTQTRTRQCFVNNVPQNIPKQCNGTLLQTKSCNSKACLLTCRDVKCTERFTKCYEAYGNETNAYCACKPAYVNASGSCVTSQNIVQVQAFKLNVTYKAEYVDLNNPETKAFTDRLAKDLRDTLQLSDKEYVKIIGLKEGSVFADFIVLLKNNSAENKTTVYAKLDSEIKTNSSGTLFEYFPVAEQIVVVVGTDLCALGSDDCNKTRSACVPTPGVGLNYRCDCFTGYTQVDPYTCIPVQPITTTQAPTTSTSDKLWIILTSVGCALIVLTCCLCFICCFRRKRRRREEEIAENVTNGSNQGYDDSILDGPTFNQIAFVKGKRMRAYSSQHKQATDPDLTQYRDVPETFHYR